MNVAAFIEQISDVGIGLLAFEPDSREIQFCNRKFKEFFGVSQDERLLEVIKHLTSHRTTPHCLESTSVRRLVWEKTILYAKVFEADDVCWIMVQNATERERLEAIAGALNVMDNIDHIFSGLRHEIANPLNTIKMTMSVLKRNFDATPKQKILNYIDRTLEEILRLEEMLHSLKSFGMFDHPSPKEIDISSFIGKFLALVESDLILKGVKIRIFSRGRLFSWMDPRALQQAMLNIVTNALDALENTPFPQIVISSFQVADRIVLKIRDNGCGMNQEQIDNLFKPFVTSKSRGTGLGLVITQKNLTKLNSSISIQSQIGQGTSVILTMPEAGAHEKKRNEISSDRG